MLFCVVWSPIGLPGGVGWCLVNQNLWGLPTAGPHCKQCGGEGQREDVEHCFPLHHPEELLLHFLYPPVDYGIGTTRDHAHLCDSVSYIRGPQPLGRASEASSAAPHRSHYCLNHLLPTTPPPAPICGKIVFHKTGPWCQKCWGPLPYSMLGSTWLPISALFFCLAFMHSATFLIYLLHLLHFFLYFPPHKVMSMLTLLYWSKFSWMILRNNYWLKK